MNKVWTSACERHQAGELRGNDRMVALRGSRLRHTPLFHAVGNQRDRKNRDQKAQRYDRDRAEYEAVSYTHLTLPTN